MRKLLLFLICLSPVIVYAYNIFTIDIPSSYDLEIDGDNYLYKDNKSNTINIKVIDNEENKDVKKYNKEELDLFKNSFIKSLNNQVNNDGIAVEVKNYKIDKYGNYNAIFIDSIYHTNDKLGYLIYQRTYFITTKRKIFYITYTSNKEKEFNNLIKNNYSDTFVITNYDKLTFLKELMYFLILLLLISLILVIKHKKNK